MNKQARAVAAVLGAVMFLGTAACQDGGNGTQTASSSASVTTPSTSSSSTLTRPSSPSHSPSRAVVIPKAAEPHTDAGALAFAKFYVIEADKAYVTADSSSIEALSSTSCTGCATAISGVKELERAGERQEARSVAIKSAAVKGFRGKTRIVYVTTTVREVRFIDASGNETGTTQAGEFVWQLGLDPKDRGWSVSEFAPPAA